MSFINNSDSWADLTIFIISLISLLEIINLVVPDSNIFSWIAALVAVAAAVNPNAIKMLLANGLVSFLITGNPIFSSGPESLPKNPQIVLFYSIEFLVILY